MENREIFSNITTVPPVFVRLDGRAFHRLTSDFGFEKPFDARFSDAMEATCMALMADSGLSPVFAYTFSDEISCYIARLPFSGRVEKLDSISASFAASALTLALHSTVPLSFDARIVQVTPGVAIEYMVNRQADAWRNHINAYCQQALITEGMTATEAAAKLKGMAAKDMHEMMHTRGMNLSKTPAWQRRGVLVRKKVTAKEGYNPKTKETVAAQRSTVTADRDLPPFPTLEGQEYLKKLICGT